MKLTYKKKNSNFRPYVCAKRRKFSKKGLSTIIVTVLLIGLTVVAVGIVWAVVNNLINERISNTEACFGNFGEVTINPEYTCYKDNPEGQDDEFQFSISIGNIDVESVLVGISTKETSKTYTIPGTYPNEVKKYGTGGAWGEALLLPGKNGGMTYVTKAFTKKPDSVKIIPVINGEQCDVSDVLNEIDLCYS